MKTMIIAAMFAAVAFTAQAQETVPVVATDAEIETVIEIVPNEALIAQFNAICASTAVLSDKARVACINNAMPKASKAGDTFRNVGVGAEMNALIRNLDKFSTATE